MADESSRVNVAKVAFVPSKSLGCNWAKHLLAGPVEAAVFLHFVISFTLSGLIALTYTYFAVQFISLRVFCPRLWLDGHGLSRHMGERLSSLRRRLRFFQLLAGIIPLAGAAMLVGVGPEQFDTATYERFRLLVTFLIGMGMIGFWLASDAASYLQRTLSVLTDREG